MKTLMEEARSILSNWRPEYVFGLGVIDKIGTIARNFGTNALVVCNTTYLESVANSVKHSLLKSGVSLAGNRIVPDAAPNAPREDVYRLQGWILHYKPDVIIAVGGGSTIDACKAASVLAGLGSLSPEIDSYFGVGIVTNALRESGKKLVPIVAVQVSASSGAHLTKYSNVTDPVKGQKKLIVDEAIVPAGCLFDYSLTKSMPRSVSVDGALDAVAHCLEVFYGVSEGMWALGRRIAEAGIALALDYGPRVMRDPSDMEAREGLGMATDLGGYAIMIGGTSGAHLTSFSLVDIASHGTACGIMNPYYMVFFAPAIQEQLRIVGSLLERRGYIKTGLESLSGRSLGIAVAMGLVEFGKALGAPTTLREIPGFSEEHIQRALAAAKNPQLSMKLRNMPIPLSSDQVDEYMEPILRAAADGEFDLIKSMK